MSQKNRSRVVVAAVAVLGAGLIVLAALSLPAPIVWILAGAYPVGLAWAIWALRIGHREEQAHNEDTRHGALAEHLTAETLRHISQPGWNYVDGLDVDGLELDHVLVGPDDVFVFEACYRNQLPKFTGPYLETREAEALARVKCHASRIQEHVGEVGVPQVQPVLVLWGPEVARHPDSHLCLDGVLVVAGPRYHEWQSELLRQNLRSAPMDVPSVMEKLEAFRVVA